MNRISFLKTTINNLLTRLPVSNQDIFLKKDYVNKGCELLGKKRYEEAIQCFLAAEKLDNRDPNIVYWLGEAYYEKGDLSLGLSLLEDADNRCPNQVNILVKKAQYYIQLFNYNEALKILLHVTRNKPKHILALNEMGYCYLMLDRIEQAVEVFTKALRIKPFEPSLHQNIAMAYFKNQNTKKALEHYLKLEKITRGKIEAVERNNLGVCYMENGCYEEALIYFHKALTQIPEDSQLAVEVKSNEIIAKCKQKKYYEAFEQLDVLYNKYPCSEIVLENVAECLIVLSKHRLAIDYYKKLVLLKPNNEKYFSQLVRCLIECGWFKDAVLYLKQHLDAGKPQSPSIKMLWYLLGLAMDGIGKHQEAIDCYNHSYGLTS